MFKQLKNDQKVVMQTLENSFKNKTTAHAYLIVSDKKDVALDLTKFICTSLLCTEEEPCLSCNDCLSALKFEHNNIYLIDDDKTIKKDVIKNLQVEFSKKSFLNKPKIFLITNANNLNDFSSNSLLKFIEEPSPDEVGIFIVDSESQVLPTIISRCQVLKLTSTNNVEEIAFLADKFSKPPLLIEILLEAKNDVQFISNILEQNASETLFLEVETFINALLDKEHCFTYISNLAKKIEYQTLFISTLLALFNRSLKNLENPTFMNVFSTLNKPSLIKIVESILLLGKYTTFNTNFSLQLEKLAITIENILYRR